MLVAMSNAQIHQSRADKEFLNSTIVPMSDYFADFVAAVTQAANDEKIDQHQKSVLKLSLAELNCRYLDDGGFLPEDTS
eukprot:2902762-Ditylum_brightwellii.AAC.1